MLVGEKEGAISDLWERRMCEDDQYKNILFSFVYDTYLKPV